MNVVKNLIYRFRYIIGILLFAAVIIAVAAGAFAIDNSTNRMIVEYAQNLGWQVESSPVEVVSLDIPREFNEVYRTYSELQKESGFDLEAFRGKACTRYTYMVKNHKESGNLPVYLGVVVYESRIIAAEIYSPGEDGFMHGICETRNLAEIS